MSTSSDSPPSRIPVRRPAPAPPHPASRAEPRVAPASSRTSNTTSTLPQPSRTTHTTSTSTRPTSSRPRTTGPAPHPPTSRPSSRTGPRGIPTTSHPNNTLPRLSGTLRTMSTSTDPTSSRARTIGPAPPPPPSRPASRNQLHTPSTPANPDQGQIEEEEPVAEIPKWTVADMRRAAQDRAEKEAKKPIDLKTRDELRREKRAFIRKMGKQEVIEECKRLNLTTLPRMLPEHMKHLLIDHTYCPSSVKCPHMYYPYPPAGYPSPTKSLKRRRRKEFLKVFRGFKGLLKVLRSAQRNAKGLVMLRKEKVGTPTKRIGGTPVKKGSLAMRGQSLVKSLLMQSLLEGASPYPRSPVRDVRARPALPRTSRLNQSDTIQSSNGPSIAYVQPTPLSSFTPLPLTIPAFSPFADHRDLSGGNTRVQDIQETPMGKEQRVRFDQAAKTEDGDEAARKNQVKRGRRASISRVSENNQQGTIINRGRSQSAASTSSNLNIRNTSSRDPREVVNRDEGPLRAIEDQANRGLERLVATDKGFKRGRSGSTDGDEDVEVLEDLVGPAGVSQSPRHRLVGQRTPAHSHTREMTLMDWPRPPPAAPRQLSVFTYKQDDPENSAPAPTSSSGSGSGFMSSSIRGAPTLRRIFSNLGSKKDATIKSAGEGTMQVESRVEGSRWIRPTGPTDAAHLASIAPPNPELPKDYMDLHIPPVPSHRSFDSYTFVHMDDAPRSEQPETDHQAVPPFQQNRLSGTFKGAVTRFVIGKDTAQIIQTLETQIALYKKALEVAARPPPVNRNQIILEAGARGLRAHEIKINQMRTKYFECLGDLERERESEMKRLKERSKRDAELVQADARESIEAVEARAKISMEGVETRAKMMMESVESQANLTIQETQYRAEQQVKEARAEAFHANIKIQEITYLANEQIEEARTELLAVEATLESAGQDVDDHYISIIEGLRNDIKLMEEGHRLHFQATTQHYTSRSQQAPQVARRSAAEIARLRTEKAEMQGQNDKLRQETDILRAERTRLEVAEEEFEGTVRRLEADNVQFKSEKDRFQSEKEDLEEKILFLEEDAEIARTDLEIANEKHRVLQDQHQALQATLSRSYESASIRMQNLQRDLRDARNTIRATEEEAFSRETAVNKILADLPAIIITSVEDETERPIRVMLPGLGDGPPVRPQDVVTDLPALFARLMGEGPATTAPTSGTTETSEPQATTAPQRAFDPVLPPSAAKPMPSTDSYETLGDLALEYTDSPITGFDEHEDSPVSWRVRPDKTNEQTSTPRKRRRVREDNADNPIPIGSPRPARNPLGEMAGSPLSRIKRPQLSGSPRGVKGGMGQGSPLKRLAFSAATGTGKMPLGRSGLSNDVFGGAGSTIRG